VRSQLKNVPRVEAAAALASVAVSVLLLAVKFWAYYLTQSAAIFSDALESIVNVAASLVAAYSLFLAHQPPDPQHPYGHGKVEFMSAGFEGGMILLAAMVIAFRAVEEMIRGPGVHELDWGLLLIFLAGAVNGVAGLALLIIGRRRDSATLRADGKHLLSDAITSLGELLALVIMWFLPHWTWVDPIAALVVAAYIAYMGVHLLGESAAGLMDRQDASDERLLRGILDAHVAQQDSAAPAREPRICSYHKLRHRHSGRYHWVDFHIVVPRDWDVARGHQVASAIEHEIEQALGEGDATAHVEPCVKGMCATCPPAPATSA
jgi:cation diffusion facilitator family transporter